MKKKGFTLIELLAVIVILAVIALIVTPIVTGIIKSAKESANARSVEGHITNVDYIIVQNAFSNGGNTNLYDGAKTESDLGFTYPANDNIKCTSYVILNGKVTQATGCKAEGWTDCYGMEEGKNAVNGECSVAVSYIPTGGLLIDSATMKMYVNASAVPQWFTNEFGDPANLGVTNIVLNTSNQPEGYTPKLNDMYLDQDYMYGFSAGGAVGPSGENLGFQENGLDGWGYIARLRTKTTYGVPSSQIAGKNVLSASNAYYNCVNMTEAPALPNSLVNISSIYKGCTSLTGTIRIDANITTYTDSFSGTVKPIVLTGTSTNLAVIAATSSGNVTVQQ